MTDFISPDFKAPCELEIDLISTYFEEEVVYLVHEGLKEESYENLFYLKPSICDERGTLEYKLLQ